MVNKLSTGTSVDISRSAQKSMFFNGCNARWNGAVVKIQELRDGILELYAGRRKV